MYRVLKGYRLLQATDGSCQLYLDNGTELIKLRCAEVEPGEHDPDPDPDPGVVTDVPVASATTLGGVKVQAGSGLSIDDEGNLSVDTATPEETQKVIDESFSDN